MMRQLFRRYLAALVGGTVLVAGLVVQDQWAQGNPVQRIPLSEVRQPVRLMVQLQGTPLADRQSLGVSAQQLATDRLLAEQALFRAQLASAGVRFRELGSFKRLFNGLSIEVDGQIAGRIAGLRGVAGTFVTGKTPMPTPDLHSSVKMIGGHKLWAGDPNLAIPGVDGTGITVAVIDTGIDYTHPDLGGCFGVGCRVISGYDFVGDEFDGFSPPIPDSDPMDQNGHGTHVAGIVGARSAGEIGVTGVAPGVSLVALKVFGPDGSTWDDIILQALEKAYDLHVDVVNMSIGSAFQWPQYPTAMAVQRLSNRGIVVATSAGNSGGAGPFATGAPSVGTGTMAVASFENEFARRPAFLDPDGRPIGFDQMDFSPPMPTQGQSGELAFAVLGITDEDFLDANGNSRVFGKVALIQRGAVPFVTKMLNAQRHGATEVLIFNNVPGIFRGTLQGAGNHLPTAALTLADGEYLRRRAELESVRLTWTDQPAMFRSDTAGLISDFSSWGPAPDLSVKPDLMAPGGSITSTFPLEFGGYASLSGTSMSSPHVAGAAALLLQARREMAQGGQALVKSSAVQTLLMNTATPQTEGPQSNVLYPVHRQGAGLIDVWQAITAQQRVLPEKIALGAMVAGATSTQVISVENLGSVTETYRFQAEGAGLDPVRVEPLVEALVVRPGRTGRVELVLTAPDGLPDQELFSGWITVLNSQSAVVARLPYVGFNGDYQAAPALDPLPPYELPWLAYLDGAFIYRSESVVIRPSCECDASYAWIMFSLARQPQELRLEIWDVQGGKKWGNVFQMKHLGRSSGGIELFVWDGLNDRGRKVPDGIYRLRLLALRPLGDPFTPTHWDRWESGTITVIWD